ncbi:MAG: elongation factor P, partial [Chloroflexi bacterium RBG_13_48_10]
ITFEFDGRLYKVLDYHHNKTGRGNASIRIKAVDLRSGTTLEKTFQSGDRVQDARLDFHNVQYLYNDGELFHFMDLDTYDQPALSKDVLGESANYLNENMEIKLTFFQGEPIDVELPITVDMDVIEADVAVRGDTATGVNKRIKTNTGLEVQ